MAFTVTPNMGLPLPNPAGSSNPEPGPQYALDQNQASTIVDGHNHSAGSGVQITPAGLNINTNLPFGNNSATGVYGVEFSSPTSSVLNTFLYTNAQAGGGVTDLFYNDGAGNVIALTKAGAVNATIASLPGESYAGGTFTWKQGAGSTTPANFDIGSITIRPVVAATTNGVVLSPPSGISSQYNVQLPLVPASVTGILQINTAGDMLSSLVPDNSTIVISSQVLKVGSISATNIADGTITPAKLTSEALGYSGAVQTYSAAGTYTYTTPAGVNAVYVIACGGGGGGGGGNSATAIANVVGGGGGSGSVVWEGIIAVSPSTAYTITIGAGGAAGLHGPVGNNSGSGVAGDSTSFGSLLVVPGGFGGTAPPSWTTSTVGTGGSGRGRAGGRASSGSIGAGGSGGNTYLLDTWDGAGGNGGPSNGSTTGGGGGGGGGSFGAGGAGGSGHGGTGVGTSGGGGGGGGGGLNPFTGDDGAAGGDGYMAIYIV